MPRLPALPFFALVAFGCPPPSSLEPNALTSAGMQGSSGGHEGSSGDEAESSGTTGATTDTGEVDESTGAGSTTDEQPMLGPPRVIEAWWTPDGPTTPGTVTLTIETKDVEWLEVRYDGVPLEMKRSADEPWIYSADVELISQLFEGTHTAVVRPFRGQDEGETVEVGFLADLPTHGSEGFWEAGAGLGQALGGTVLPGLKDDVYEFGTLDPGGQPGCYLRRRSADGLAPVKDVVEIQPGNKCTATDGDRSRRPAAAALRVRERRRHAVAARPPRPVEPDPRAGAHRCEGPEGERGRGRAERRDRGLRLAAGRAERHRHGGLDRGHQ